MGMTNPSAILPATPTVTIFVRHGAKCPRRQNAFCKTCRCSKHLRWTQDGHEQRASAKTRSWEIAEQKKRDLEDRLSGRLLESPADTNKQLRSAIDLFLTDKRTEGIALKTITRYACELDRLLLFCESIRIYTVQGVSREVLTRYSATWPFQYPSSITRSKVRERLSTFLRYCFEAEWLKRIPAITRIVIDEPETMPFTGPEFEHLLASIPKGLPNVQSANARVKVRALFLLMRWSGLAIGDALCLPRTAIEKTRNGMYQVVTTRKKTGTDISVPIPPDVALEILSISNVNPLYFFWSGASSIENLATKWGERFVRPVFEAADLYDEDMHMVSHRLRDTFAVYLLEHGTPMEEVSRLLGHTSIKTTEKHYAKWSKGRQERADSFVVSSWSSAA